MDNIAIIYLFLAMGFSALFGAKIALIVTIYSITKNKVWPVILVISCIPTTTFIYFAVKGVIKLVGGAP